MAVKHQLSEASAIDISENGDLKYTLEPSEASRYWRLSSYHWILKRIAIEIKSFFRRKLDLGQNDDPAAGEIPPITLHLAKVFLQF
jgi:hypothetical protein